MIKVTVFVGSSEKAVKKSADNLNVHVFFQSSTRLGDGTKNTPKGICRDRAIK